MSTLDRAIEIAVKVHAGRTDLAREPYLLHVMRVLTAVDGPDAQIVAALHDVVEDSLEWTLDDLRREGFSEDVVQAVDAVSCRDGEEYQDFIQRAARNRLGRLVKIADLQDNLRPGRAQLSASHRQRYLAALAYLRQAAPRSGT